MPPPSDGTWLSSRSAPSSSSRSFPDSFFFEKAYFLAGGPHLLPGEGGGGGGGAGQHRLTGWRRNSRILVADHGEKKDTFRHPVAVATCGESPLVLMPFLLRPSSAAC